jgi:sugar phosphate isomerase/epimerase
VSPDSLKGPQLFHGDQRFPKETIRFLKSLLGDERIWPTVAPCLALVYTDKKDTVREEHHMKLGAFTVLLGDRSLDSACEFLAERGIQAIEVGCGGYPGKAHCDPKQLLGNPQAIRDFKNAYERHGIELAALSVQGNNVHPDPAEAARFHGDFEDAVWLASELGIDRVVGFSGCPGGAPGDAMPNWTCVPWPEENLKILDYQWNEVLIPYWTRMAKFATEHGIQRIALEMHPGFCVYNPQTVLRMREAVGPIIGANLDPSHLFWQGADIGQAIRYLGEAIYFFHAKDTRIDPINAARTGNLDTKHYSDEINRSWVFRSVGYGHGLETWRDIVTNLRMVGYDDVLSIEHEDSLMSLNEGLNKAIGTLKEAMCFESTSGMWWA